jgi:uncharacterized protein (TIGR00369 family)
MTNEVFVEFLNDHSKNTLMETLEIKFDSSNKEEGWLKGSMPVLPKHHQPFGILHGGASVSLAESLGSAASLMYIDLKAQAISGISIAANHVKSKKEGIVYGTAKILHKGKTTHLWEIKIEDEKGRLISLCKLTNLVINK